MTTQLTLVHLPGHSGIAPAPAGAADGASPWRLDEQTRAVGRAGIARARAILAETRHPVGTPGTDEPAAA